MPNKEANTSRAKAKNNWRKIRSEKGLYQYEPSRVFFARLRKGGRLHRESLRTRDLATARRLLRDLRQRLDRTDARFGKISFVDYLTEHYLPTLRGAESTLQAKRRVIQRVKRTWLAARAKPMNELKPSEVERWLNEQYGNWTSGSFNGALTVIRDALEMAVRDNALMTNAAAHLKYRKRERPIRLTPSWEQFQAIVESVR